MNVKLRSLTEIKPYEKNPRINDQAVDAVAESIRRFGFRQPIVVDGDGVIVCGHTRWKAARKLGLAKVSVHVATDLTAEQIQAYRIADEARPGSGQHPVKRFAEFRQGTVQTLAFVHRVLGDQLMNLNRWFVHDGETPPEAVG